MRIDTSSPPHPSPVVILGGGPTGLIAAALLGAQNIDVTLVAPPAPDDPRTTALMAGSLQVLATIGIWPALSGRAAPLRHLRMVDATRRLFRAPEVTFHAAEVGLEAFGWNIPNVELTGALRERIAAMPSIRTLSTKAAAVTPDEDGVRIALEGGEQLYARLVIAADGRRSLSREAAGVDSRCWQYRQAALALSLRHDRPHNDTSTEFHTESGPFTLVPLPGNRSSLVAGLRPDDAERLKALDADALGAELTTRSHNILGRLEPDGPCGVFPLGASVVTQFGARRIALVGEAAHLLPPIGAQGLNLGVRDAEAIATVAAQAIRLGADPGKPAVLSAYGSARRRDVWPRTIAVDALNRSLLAGFIPSDMARGLGLRLIAGIAPIRKFAMRAGIGAR
ncbi:2-octaprenyl-6-methoxyphenyl hydroxylase [Agaricicola taiwanensis]|uniref:2-octaprenyl-6-methoxyphenyl hydroxylase n=1 Tax=Agaricicola taiwanensis TaxID=591372 RepID=A0A8J2YIU6_9RHOB|nr:UbiH/UbiF family hydroxylase [Agaricicola taiwanensis]GGE45806.1 2-octaprenyl-6-methoxyphenyl hydroxylase [Agaricicola taiwanensis]